MGAIERHISIRSPSDWNDFIFPIHRTITKLMLENLPITITEKLLLEILLPMVSQHPEDLLQVSTIDTNTYFVFLKTVVYSISNNLTHVRNIADHLNSIDRQGYRRSFKALLSQKLVSITVACERLMPVFYSRGDEDLIEHVRQSQPGLISHFSIIRGLLELGSHSVYFGSWPSIKSTCTRTFLFFDMVDFHRAPYKRWVKGLSYEACLKKICGELIEFGIKPTSLPEARLLFYLCYDLEDFAPFCLVTPQNLVSALAVLYSEEQNKSLLFIHDVAQVQLLLEAGFKLDYGLEEKLLGVIILENNAPTREFWLKLWKSRQCLSSNQATTDGDNDDKITIRDFIRIFDVATQHIYSSEVPEVQGGIGYFCVTSEYGDIINDLLKNELPEIVLWELLIVSHLIALKPASLNHLLEFLSLKYPNIDFGTYLFYIVLRMRYQPEDYLRIHYGYKTNCVRALHALSSRGVDVNFKLDSLVSLVSYVIQACSLFAEIGYPKDFELESGVLDLLVEMGSSLNPPLPYCPSNCLGQLCYYQHLRPIDMAYWGELKEYFCYLLSRGACLNGFPVKPMGSQHWTPCPLFVQAAHRYDLEYVSEHWDARMRGKYGGAFRLDYMEMWPRLEIVTHVTHDFGDAKKLLALKTHAPTPEELFNLIAVLAVEGGRRSDMKGPVLTKTEIEYGFKLISTAIHSRLVEIDFKMPYQNDYRSPLYLSIIYDNVKLMEHILDLGADPLIYWRTDIFRPNLSAVQLAAGVNLQLLKALVARGADVNHPPSRFKGSTALHEAIENGKLSCLSYLLSKGADLHTLDTEENTEPGWIELQGEQPVPSRSALEYAILKGRIDAVSLILQVEPSCQPMALELARKHHQSTLATYIETWKPGSQENTTEDEDVEMTFDLGLLAL
ncbi:hypothetical protein TWF506_003374 [Arthrobotrys conoides]|uniref:Uncharacterized protein n=1 Tax=Arthrobotrys conoides TaxID=74498 RepID=A0AAN8NCK6_9PEZI